MNADRTWHVLSNVEKYSLKHSVEETLKYIENIIGKHRALRVKESLFENRVVKIVLNNNREHWFFLGKTNTYILIPKTFCSCIDFEINVVERKKIPACYHLVTQVLAQVYGRYRIVRDIKPDDLLCIYGEIEERQISATLHKYLLLKR